MTHQRRILPPNGEGTTSYCTACDWYHFTDSIMYHHAVDVLENHAQAWISHMDDYPWDFPKDSPNGDHVTWDDVRRMENMA